MFWRSPPSCSRAELPEAVGIDEHVPCRSRRPPTRPRRRLDDRRPSPPTTPRLLASAVQGHAYELALRRGHPYVAAVPRPRWSARAPTSTGRPRGSPRAGVEAVQLARVVVDHPRGSAADGDVKGGARRSRPWSGPGNAGRSVSTVPVSDSTQSELPVGRDLEGLARVVSSGPPPRRWPGPPRGSALGRRCRPLRSHPRTRVFRSPQGLTGRCRAARSPTRLGRSGRSSSVDRI